MPLQSNSTLTYWLLTGINFVVIGFAAVHLAARGNEAPALPTSRREPVLVTPASAPIAATSTPPLSPVPSSAAMGDSLVGKLDRLLDEIARTPGADIPEMAFLTDDELIRVAARSRFGSEEQTRHSLALARTFAKSAFLQTMNRALKEYQSANDGKLPASATELAPFFKPAINTDLLYRYETVPENAAGQTTAVPFIRETTPPVDEAYDLRTGLTLRGESITLGRSSAAWISHPKGYSTMLSDARRAFRHSNQDRDPQT